MRMKHDPIVRAKRRATDITLSEGLTEQARELGINVSQACERGLPKEVKAERDRRWVEEHRPAMQAFNAWLEGNGIPLEDIRVLV
jgi:antitoxin CcdA